MFKCAVTKKMSKPGESQIKLVVETRKKTYFGPAFEMEEDGEGGKKRWLFQKDNYGNVLLDDDGKPIPVLMKVGEGFETVREIAVTQEGYNKYMGIVSEPQKVETAEEKQARVIRENLKNYKGPKRG